MPKLFADLHCHPILYTFNRLRNGPDDQDPTRFHPWNVAPSNPAKQESGARATEYSQCCPPKLAASRTRLVFASLTPIERGFFEPGPEPGRHRPFTVEALKLATGVTMARAAARFAREGRDGLVDEATAILRNRGPLRQALQTSYLKYPLGRIRYLMSDAYDYWDELERAYEFLCNRDGVDSTYVDTQTDTSETGRYELVRDGDHLRQVVEGSDETLAFVLSIEGGHVFSIGPDEEPVPESVMFRRIEELKGWPHPIALLTPAHHFDNGFCGHARSIPDVGSFVLDQSRRLGEGLEPKRDLGVRVLRAILDLDDTLEDKGKRRMLIDCKHFSARTRKEYYDQIVRPYNERWERWDEERKRRFPKLPVIHSHTAYSGVATLDELAKDLDRQNDHWHVNAFNAWSINCSDEDVREVFRSEGLLGVCFDQRIAGVLPGQRVPDEHYGHVLLKQILGLADVILLDDRIDDDEKITIWDRICIGSDYDGVIDPLSGYPTVLSLRRLADDLAELLGQVRHTRMIERVGVDELVEKLCWRNIYELTLRQMPAIAGGDAP